MKPVVRNILALSFLALVAVCLMAAMEASSAKNGKLPCKSLSVILKDRLEDSF